MIQKKVVMLGDGCTAEVRELTLGELPALADILSDRMLEASPSALIGQHLMPILLAIAPTVTLSDGRGLAEASLSEALQIRDAWMEVNRDFFSQVAVLVGASVAGSSASASGGCAPPCSCGDAPIPGDGAIPTC